MGTVHLWEFTVEIAGLKGESRGHAHHHGAELHRSVEHAYWLGRI